MVSRVDDYNINGVMFTVYALVIAKPLRKMVPFIFMNTTHHWTDANRQINLGGESAIKDYTCTKLLTST